MQPEKKSLCENFELSVWFFLDGELPEAEQKEWQAHLSTCRECSQKLDAFENVEEVYQELPGYDVSNDAFNKHINRAVAHSEITRKVYQPVPTLFKKLGAVLLPATIILFFLLRTHNVDSKNLNWEPANYDASIAEIDSSLNVLEDDLLWADSGTSSWDSGLDDIELDIEEISAEIDTYK